jgi:ABC-2 type transport system permease protein
VKALAIAIVNTKRFLREKSNVFFVFVFPLLIVLLIGVAFGGSFDSRIGVIVEDDGGPLADALVAEIDALDDVATEPFETRAELTDAVQRGQVQGGLVVPAGYDAMVAGDDVIAIQLITRPDSNSQLVAETVRGAVTTQAIPIRAARFVASGAGIEFSDALATAEVVAASGIGVTVTSRTVGDSVFEEFENLGTFDLGAHQELVLFVFITSMAGSAALIQTRQYGVSRRMLSTPTPIGTILVGETIGRFGVAITQGLYIMLGTLIVFGVEWGDPLGAIALLVMFSLVGASVGILAGAVFSNDQQAGGIGVLIGLGLAALGGAMVPIEIFPDTMATIAKATPHAWAIDGYSELVRRGGTFVDVLPNLGVLAAFAAVIMLLGAWRLRSVLTH